MLLESKEIKAIIESTFVLDFVAITLVQQKNSDVTSYKGPGSIFQDKDGILQLKMYHTYESQEEMNHEIHECFSSSGLISGKIIESHHYYSLEALDMKGRVWKADYIRLSGNTSFPATGKVIESQLSSITNILDRFDHEDISKSHVSYIISGRHNIPCNKLEKTEKRSSFSICDLNLEGYQCNIKKRDNYLELSANNLLNSVIEPFSHLLLEAVSIGIGSFLRPLVKIMASGKHRTITIFSRKIERNINKLQAPIPTNRPHDATNLNEFVNKYIGSITKPFSPIFGYWYRILSESAGELENKALVLTTSIEGILKEYYKNYGIPDSKFLEQVSSATEIINGLDVGQRAKERILSTLGNARSMTPKGALYALSKEQIIPEKLIKVWVKLRNKSAHAHELKRNNEELQEFLDQIFGCQELFYLLLMNHIQYTGEFFQFSKEAWPISSRAN